MKCLLAGSLVLALTLPAQKIETETPARDRVVKVQTAMNHLTVIEVAEPVTTVAVGSPQTFKVERRENEVFVRYTIENRSQKTFRTGGPTVVSLNDPHFDTSLWALQNSQLGIEYGSRLRSKGEPVPVKITQTEPAIAEVGPGKARVGVV